ncbi:MAG: DUF1553 domain-containing protein [Bacteroidota bacterium]
MKRPSYLPKSVVLLTITHSLYRYISLIGVSLTISLFVTSCGVDKPAEIVKAEQILPEKLDYNLHVKPILSDKCFACHGPDEASQEAGLELATRQGALAALQDSPGEHAIVPGKLAKSVAFHRIVSEDPEQIMPPPESNLTLSDYEKAVLIRWMEEGAEYKPHWAFVKPEKREIPEIANEAWAKNSIDYFIAKKLAENNFSPSKQAEKSLLLRRLSLDLTGLPPTPNELKKFLADDSPDAYEKQVDRLLASPHYGEKMATDWMDVARYADTYGYQVDRVRDMSPWRTWVIKSFNQNMPYDQFITWQLAGDMLPEPTTEQKLATGFSRLHPQNAEGGIVDEEFRVEYVSDRVSVVGQGLMALTLACARCHDHKYDPVSQKNFYELSSFFNNINETGQISWDPNDTPVPTMLLPDSAQKKILAFFEKEVAQNEAKVQEAEKVGKERAEAWINAGNYQQEFGNQLTKGRVGHFTFDGHLRNQIGGKAGKMERTGSSNEKPDFVSTEKVKGIKFNGDSWLDLKPVGIYSRSQPFSVGIWVNLPDSLKEGVIFHKCKGARLHSYKGYHLYLRDNKLEVLLAHTWPDNAIEKHSIAEVPRNQWIQLTMTYDGSSSADGLKLYLDGKELETEVIADNLYKDILFNNYEDQIYQDPIEPGLKIGGRWRGFGIRDAVADEVVVYDRVLTPLEVMQVADVSIGEIIQKAPTELSAEEKSMLTEYYLTHFYAPYRSAEKGLLAARMEQVEEMEKVKEVMIMKEMPEPRQAYVLERGLYDQYGEEVFPSTPERIFSMPDSLPKNRLGLAQWLTHPDHPLTARVAVNRYWQHFFGRGIVKTTEDFGNQGDLPTHPELLDWLALEFINGGWDVKALVKMIVMSATYRQSSLTSPELREKDPENVWLARGPKSRLTSEMIRDNALAASGLLNKKIGGKSVKPYQPEGLWKMNGGEYTEDTGDDLYRRSLYTLWKRSVPNPTQATFDQPERSECTVRRQKTNTPLQALVLLNDPTFVETSRKIGEDITKAENTEQGITTAFVKLTGRSPRQEEIKILKTLRESEYQKFKDDPTRAKGWLEAGAYEVDPSLDTNLIAANAIVASAILNADATINKR